MLAELLRSRTEDGVEFEVAFVVGEGRPGVIDREPRFAVAIALKEELAGAAATFGAFGLEVVADGSLRIFYDNFAAAGIGDGCAPREIRRQYDVESARLGFFDDGLRGRAEIAAGQARTHEEGNVGRHHG